MSSADRPDRANDGEARRRRSQLLALKLRALVRDQLGVDDAAVADLRPFPPGAAVVLAPTSADETTAAWVLLDEQPADRLGSAVAWALRQGVARLDVVAEDGTGTLARRAAELAFPVAVWRVDGRDLRPAEPEALAPPPPPTEAHLDLVELIVAGGATPVVEHGVVTGEVRGLEVCRVVDDPALGVVRLEVGVGVHDREAFQLVHGDVPTVDALRTVVEAVTAHRSPEVPHHPLNRLAAERFLRWRLEQEPELVGAAQLAPGQPPVPRANVRDAVPCVAVGTGLDGAPLVVVCSSGVDLEVVPYAIDARLAAASTGVGGGSDGVSADVVRTVVALPGRDRVAITTELAGLVRQPLAVRSVD